LGKSARIVLQGVSAPFPKPIIQREEDGQYQVGSGDDADGPFPSRHFAEAVAHKAVRQ
jgi:hypothetical protein